MLTPSPPNHVGLSFLADMLLIWAEKQFKFPQHQGQEWHRPELHDGVVAVRAGGGIVALRPDADGAEPVAGGEGPDAPVLLWRGRGRAPIG